MIKSFERYAKNTTAFSQEDVERIREKKVCIVGCGGLGGYVAQSLVRFGVGELTLVDGDVFNESNLNRQIFSSEKNLGHNKALETKKALFEINSDVKIKTYEKMLDEKNANDILSGNEIAVDCLDNIPSRFVLDHGCAKLHIPYIHGAIGGFYGQVSTIFPGEQTLSLLYPQYQGAKSKGIERDLGNPPFTPQLVASIQAMEAVKVLLGFEDLLRNKFLYIDLLHNDFQVIDYSK